MVNRVTHLIFIRISLAGLGRASNNGPRCDRTSRLDASHILRPIGLDMMMLLIRIERRRISPSCQLDRRFDAQTLVCQPHVNGQKSVLTARKEVSAEAGPLTAPAALLLRDMMLRSR